MSNTDNSSNDCNDPPVDSGKTQPGLSQGKGIPSQLGVFWIEANRT